MAQKKITIVGLEDLTVQAVDEAPPEYLYSGMLPDSPFYFLKNLLYKVKGSFVFGDTAKVRWFLKMADKGAAEARGLIDKEKSEMAGETLEKAILARNKAFERLQIAQKAGQDVDELVLRLEKTSLRQQATLDYVWGKVPDSAKGTIRQAKEKSQRGHQQAIESLKKGTPAAEDEELEKEQGGGQGKQEGKN